MTCRNWLITLNNPGHDHTAQEYLERIHKDLKARYTCGQLEKGTEGTVHIQFFMNFPNATRISVFQKFDKRLHCEKV